MTRFNVKMFQDFKLIFFKEIKNLFMRLTMTLSVKSANVRESTENVRVTKKNAPNVLTFTNYPTRQLDFDTIFICSFYNRLKNNFSGRTVQKESYLP